MNYHIVVWSYTHGRPVICNVLIFEHAGRELMSWKHDGKAQSNPVDYGLLSTSVPEAWEKFSRDGVIPKTAIVNGVQAYCRRMVLEAGR